MFSILIAEAAEAATAAQEPSLMGSLAPLVMIFVVFYFLILRPQQKKAKEHVSMLNELSKGESVMLNSGIIGKVADVGEKEITLEVSDGMYLQVRKDFVSEKINKESQKKTSGNAKKADNKAKTPAKKTGSVKKKTAKTKAE
jgi:preprotein translocase subunit YajC